MVLAVGPTTALIFFVPLWGPQLVLAGLTSPSNSESTLRRFSVSDVMVLMALMSAASALTSNLRDEMPPGSFLMLLGAANTLAALMWYKCNRFMASNGILDNSRRIAMHLFIYPSSILSIAYLAISSLMLISGLIGAASNNDFSSISVFLSVVATMFLGATAWVYLTRWIYRKFIQPETVD